MNMNMKSGKNNNERNTKWKKIIILLLIIIIGIGLIIGGTKYIKTKISYNYTVKKEELDKYKKELEKYENSEYVIDSSLEEDRLNIIEEINTFEKNNSVGEYKEIVSEYNKYIESFKVEVDEAFTSIKEDLEKFNFEYFKNNYIKELEDYSTDKCVYDIMDRKINFEANKDKVSVEEINGYKEEYDFIEKLYDEYEIKGYQNYINEIKTDYKKDVNMYEVNGEKYLMGFILDRPALCVIDEEQNVLTSPYNFVPSNFNYEHYNGDIIDYKKDKKGNVEVIFSMVEESEYSRMQHAIGKVKFDSNGKYVDGVFKIGRTTGGGVGWNNYFVELKGTVYEIEEDYNTKEGLYKYTINKLDENYEVVKSIEVGLDFESKSGVPLVNFDSYVVMNDKFNVYIKSSGIDDDEYDINKCYVIDKNLKLISEKEISEKEYKSQIQNNVLETDGLYKGIEPVQK